MFKVGQKVKIKPEHAYSGPPPHNPDTVFEIEFLDHSYVSLCGHGFNLWVLPLNHIRPLMKKKPPAKPGIFKFAPQPPPVTLKSEVDWTRKVQRNFKGDGAFIPDDMEAPVRAMREYFAADAANTATAMGAFIVDEAQPEMPQPVEFNIDEQLEREERMAVRRAMEAERQAQMTRSTEQFAGNPWSDLASSPRRGNTGGEQW